MTHLAARIPPRVLSCCQKQIAIMQAESQGNLFGPLSCNLFDMLALHNLERRLWRKAEKAKRPIGQRFPIDPCSSPFRVTNAKKPAAFSQRNTMVKNDGWGIARSIFYAAIFSINKCGPQG